MKKLVLITVTVLMAVTLSGCGDDSTSPEQSDKREYRQDMRDFVIGISAFAKGINPDFLVITQNGHELLTENGEETGALSTEYIHAIDGVGREDLFYGYYDDNEITPESEKNLMMAFMDIAESNGVEVLVTDYCWTPSFMKHSYDVNDSKGYISFSADHRELDNIPACPETLFHCNASGITSLADAKNFLYLINSGCYLSKKDLLDAMCATDYDIVITDLFYNTGEELSPDDVLSLKFKANGAARLVISYMSIGEAENYRYYWQPEWNTQPPSWLAGENPDWPDNYKVRYWDREWQNIMYGSGDSYGKKIIDAGFDGVYLDIIDAFEYFEDQ